MAGDRYYKYSTVTIERPRPLYLTKLSATFYLGPLESEQPAKGVGGRIDASKAW